MGHYAEIHALWKMNRIAKFCSIVVIGILSQQAIVVHSVNYQDGQSSSDNDGGSPANYKFQYAVNEGSSGNDFGHEEERNGQQTRGQYRVLLPDGRLQIVTYTADQNGYRAEVTYENRGSSYNTYQAPSKPTQTQNPNKSYPAPPPPQPATDEGYSSGNFQSGNSGGGSSYGKRTSGSFVNLRRKINGRSSSYNYDF